MLIALKSIHNVVILGYIKIRECFKIIFIMINAWLKFQENLFYASLTRDCLIKDFWIQTEIIFNTYKTVKDPNVLLLISRQETID